ncbi:MAG TPA: helix-turn-helix domain-containing protein [Candidatus Limnocylindrales bacterium]|nr:helix-turn-helix domain-containing protein [Candidatus Limnocylindrales bacterium]
MRTRIQIGADRGAANVRRKIGEELRRIREDAGLTRATVAERAGIDASYLGDIENGEARAGLEIMFRVAAALDADLSLRVFPNTGPRIRDRLQAPILEALLGLVGPGWERHPEIVVSRPVRGIIDLVIAAPLGGQVVSIEIHSDLHRVEQQIRWAAEKSDALPSSTIWSALAATSGTATARLLVLRSTSRTRSLVRQFASTFDAAYPADAALVREALADPTVPWPGNGLLWARIAGGVATILPGAPRGVRR